LFRISTFGFRIFIQMSLSRQDVEKVSLLGRLLLTPPELDLMTSQLGGIVAYVEQLAELDQEIAAKNVQPMAHAVELTNVFRADEVRPSLERPAALANAPQHDEECYRVPAVLGE
jgi:aspartyl-tRNA(Asn)/glutamyl-tRNA(Gln) amidotransferase subunit C